MGVVGLWLLLAPCGHRMSIETLGGKRLAIDVSIWLAQFVKAMRDKESGMELRNAHLVGMLRRLLRLLYHRIQPVFVFDGPAPRLKKQTIAQRQRQRHAAKDDLQRTAERLLLQRLKMQSTQQLRAMVAQKLQAKQETAAAAQQKKKSKKKQTSTEPKSDDASNDVVEMIDVDAQDDPNNDESNLVTTTVNEQDVDHAMSSLLREQMIELDDTLSSDDERLIQRHNSNNAAHLDEDERLARALQAREFGALDVPPRLESVDSSGRVRSSPPQRRQHDDAVHLYVDSDEDDEKQATNDSATQQQQQQLDSDAVTASIDRIISQQIAAHQQQQQTSSARATQQPNQDSLSHYDIEDDDDEKLENTTAPVDHEFHVDRQALKSALGIKTRRFDRRGRRPADDPQQQQHDSALFQIPQDGRVDAAVLARLPISMQFLIREQQREHNHAESVQQFAALSDRPAEFSQRQMAGYLQSVAFNKEIQTIRDRMHSEAQSQHASEWQATHGSENDHSDDAKEHATTDESKQRSKTDSATPNKTLSRQKPSSSYVFYKKIDTSSASAPKRQLSSTAATNLKRENSSPNHSNQSRMQAIEQERRTRHEMNSNPEWRCAVCDEVNRWNASAKSMKSDSACWNCGAPRIDDELDGSTAVLRTAGGGQSRSSNALPFRTNSDAHVMKRENINSSAVRSSHHDFNDDTALSARPIAPSSRSWNCSQCSLRNDASLTHCEVCRASKYAQLGDKSTQQAALAAFTNAPSTASVSAATTLQSQQREKTPAAAVATVSNKSKTVRFSESTKPAPIDSDTIDALFDSMFDSNAAAAVEPQSSAKPAPGKGTITAAQWLEQGSSDDSDVVVVSSASDKQSASQTKAAPAPEQTLFPTELGAIATETTTQTEDEDMWENESATAVTKAEPVTTFIDSDSDVMLDDSRSSVVVPPVVVDAESTVELDNDAMSPQHESLDGAAYFQRSAADDALIKQKLAEAQREVEQQQQQRQCETAHATPIEPPMFEQQIQPPTQQPPVQQQQTSSVSPVQAAAPTLSPAELIAQSVRDASAARARNASPAATLAAPTASTAAAAPTSASPIQLPTPTKALKEPAARPAGPTNFFFARRKAAELAKQQQSESSPSVDAAGASAATTVPASINAASADAASLRVPSPSPPALRSAFEVLTPPDKNSSPNRPLQRAHSTNAATARTKNPSSPSAAQYTSDVILTERQAEIERLYQAGQSGAVLREGETPALQAWTGGDADETQLDDASIARYNALLDANRDETSHLYAQQRTARRQEAQVTEQMIRETQELLRQFGVPFIVSPAEAEAQCAALETLGLVDGVVTEDNDVFLFGAQNVYRHFFETKRFAEKYRAPEIAARLGLDRLQLIKCAMLLGSDYTQGVRGVGIVNAVEICNAFPGPDGLRHFKQWVYSASLDHVEPAIPRFTDDTTLEEKAELTQQYRVAYFKYKHRNLRANWGVERDFPRQEVIDAYFRPEVDSSTQPFAWARPDWPALAQYLARVLGWSLEYVEQTLAPVRESMSGNSETAQNTLERFFDEDDKFADITSKRVMKAVTGLTRKVDAFEAKRLADKEKAAAKEAAKALKKAQQQQNKGKKKATGKKAVTADAASQSTSPNANLTAGDDESDASTAKSKRKKAPVKRKTKAQKIAAANAATLSAASPRDNDANSAAAAAVSAATSEADSPAAVSQGKRKRATAPAKKRPARKAITTLDDIEEERARAAGQPLPGKKRRRRTKAQIEAEAQEHLHAESAPDAATAAAPARSLLDDDWQFDAALLDRIEQQYSSSPNKPQQQQQRIEDEEPIVQSQPSPVPAASSPVQVSPRVSASTAATTNSAVRVSDGESSSSPPIKRRKRAAAVKRKSRASQDDLFDSASSSEGSNFSASD